MDKSIDVQTLIQKYSVEQLSEAADRYWQRLGDHPRTLAKPFNLGDVEHILAQISFVIQGLQLNPGMTILDFGAGSCYASRILNQLGLRVISLDVSEAALEIGRKLSARFPPIGNQPEHQFLRFDGRRFALPSESVDRILCLDALHHVPDQEVVLAEMGRVLRHGGIAGFSEPGPMHSKEPAAQFEMRNFTVIENDIVLPSILEVAKRHGFTAMRIAVAPIHPTFVQYEGLERLFSEPSQFLAQVYGRVTNFPIFFLHKGSADITDSRLLSGLKGLIVLGREKVIARVDEEIRLYVTVRNTSTKDWLPSGDAAGCVNLGAFLHTVTSGGSMPSTKELRFSVSDRVICPGGVVERIEVSLGRLPRGSYRLELDLVSEYISWFQSQCDSMVTVEIYVE